MTETATLTPQNAFPLVGSLEDEKAIKAVALRLITDDAAGLLRCCISDDEQLVCRHLLRVLDKYPDDAKRKEIGRVKEIALLHWGSPIMSAVDYLASAMRTPAIAESAIRSAGNAMFEAAERTDPPLARETRELFRQTMAQVIEPMSDEELAV